MSKFLKGLIFFLAFTSSVFALEVPSLTGPVVDEAQFLSRDTHVAIENALRNFYQSEGIQFQVLIIDKLVDESIEGYSIKVVDEWKLGKKGEDKAALFLIALDDRKMRIEVGRGLEGTLTDLTTRR
ncbi:MAG: TPM domain-containing protein, partial [Bdellovibrionales bacterium]|nr:TPM domain-containing protein [Bdellovibrionales bacterium]